MADLPDITWDDDIKWDKPAGGKEPNLGSLPIALPPAAIASKENVNKARVVGTGLIKGGIDALDALNLAMGGGFSPDVTVHLSDWVRRQLGLSPIPDEAKKAYVEQAGKTRLDIGGTVKKGLESIGVPTEPETEAKRLGVPYEGLTKAVATGAQYGTAAALSGTGAVGSTATAALAGAGEAVGGPTGALVGSLAALPLMAKGRPPAEPPRTSSILAEAKAALDDFAAIPAAIKPEPFKRYAASVEDAINPYKRASALYQQVPLENQDTARPIIEKIRTWATGKRQDGLPIYGFTMQDLKSLRDDISTGLEQAPFGSPDARTLMIAKRNLDAFIGKGFQPQEVLHGDVASAVQAYREGIPLYARAMAAKQAERMSDLSRIRSGGYRLPNMDAATRGEFIKAIRNQRTMARLEGSAPGITDVLEEAAIGGDTRRLMAYVGRFGPQSVMPGLYVLHEAAKGKAKAVTAGIIAGVSREIANRLAVRDAARVAEFIRRGGPRPPTTYTYRPNLAPAIEGSEDQ